MILFNYTSLSPDMKLLIFGHSYVRDLATLNVNSMTFDQRPIEIKYVSFPGANFDKFVEKPSLLNEIVSNKPDVIVVILGGNSIHKDVPNFVLFNKCKAFYQLLRNKLPNATIIASQVELRFYSTPNKFGSPSADEFKKKRNELNKCLNRLKTKDYLLIIAGPGRLDNKAYFKDDVHMNRAGLRVYLAILKTTVAYALEKNKSKQN